MGLQTPSKGAVGEACSRGSSPGSTSAGSSLSPGSSAAAPRGGTPGVGIPGTVPASIVRFGDLEPMPAYVEGTLLQKPATTPAVPNGFGQNAPKDGLLEPCYVVGDESPARSAAALHARAGLYGSPLTSSSNLEALVGQTFAAAVIERGPVGPAGAECAVVPGPHPGLATSVVQPSAILQSKAAFCAVPTPWHPEAGSRIAPGSSPWPWSVAATTSPSYPASPVLRLDLAEALPEPELGSPEKPTLGSATHRLGNCKPCAFLYTKGCMNGLECPFCHLCDAGEKKRRQKEKKDQKREICKWVEGQTVVLNNLALFTPPALPR